MPRRAPCGTFSAYKRHKRNDEEVDEACAQAARDQRNERSAAKRAKSADAVKNAVNAAPPVENIDPLEEALDNLRIVRAVLRDEGTPANTVAALTKRRDELVDRIQKLREAQAPAEVSVVDELTNRRRDRRAKATG